MSCTRAAVCFLAFVVLHEQPGDARAERGLPRLQRQPDLLARLRLLPAGRQCEHSIDGIPELRERVVRGTVAAPASGATPRPPPRCGARRRDRRGCARNWADHAVSGYGPSLSSMSRIARPSRLRSFWTRSSCSESLRLRSPRSVCSTRRPAICRVIYQESATTAASVMIRPSSSAVVGERPSAARLSSTSTSPRPGGAAFPLPDDQVRRRWLAAQLAQARGVLAAVIVTVHGALGERLGHRNRQRGILEPRD